MFRENDVQGNLLKIVVDLQARHARLTLANPPLNLVDRAMLAELSDALGLLALDDQVKSLILTGEGERAFCAGSDLKTTLALKTQGTFIADKLGPETDIFSALADFPKPTIAVLNAAALGGGLELAACCDLIVAKRGIKIGLPEINIAGFPPTGVVRLARRTGLGRINQLILLGEPIMSETAHEWGVIDTLANADESPLDIALNWAERFAQLPSRALQMSKRAIAIGQGGDSRAQLAEVLAFSELLSTAPDALEGPTAFLAKRAPAFSDAPLLDHRRVS